jgi:hypothetical protein
MEGVLGNAGFICRKIRFWRGIARSWSCWYSNGAVAMSSFGFFFLEKVREQWAKGSNFLVRSICNGLSPAVPLLFLIFYYQYKVVFEYFCWDSKKRARNLGTGLYPK